MRISTPSLDGAIPQTTQHTEPRTRNLNPEAPTPALYPDDCAAHGTPMSATHHLRREKWPGRAATPGTQILFFKERSSVDVAGRRRGGASMIKGARGRSAPP